MPIKRVRRAVTTVARRVKRTATAPVRWIGTQMKKEADARKKQDAAYEWEAQKRANQHYGGYAGSVRIQRKKRK